MGRSRSSKGLGKPKKGGAGGKYTWGGMLAEAQDGVAIDHNDPNYDSDDDGMPVSLRYEYAEDLEGYKLAVSTEFGLPMDRAFPAQSLAAGLLNNAFWLCNGSRKPRGNVCASVGELKRNGMC